MKLQSRVLNTFYFPGSHDGPAVYKELKKIADIWGISKKIVAVVSDNASVMRCAVQLSHTEEGGGKWLWIPCFAHTLNLLVRDSFKDNLEVYSLIKTCREIVTLFKQSAKAMSYLKNLAKNQPSIKIETLKQDVPTRWNSTLIMIRSVLAFGETLNEALRLAQRTDLEIGQYDRLMLEELLSVLEYFEEATVELSSQLYPSLSKVIPVVKQLQDGLSQLSFIGSVEMVRLNLLNGLHFRFRTPQSGNFASEEIEKVPARIVATYLDPR